MFSHLRRVKKLVDGLAGLALLSSGCRFYCVSRTLRHTTSSRPVLRESGSKERSGKRLPLTSWTSTCGGWVEALASCSGGGMPSRAAQASGALVCLGCRGAEQGDSGVVVWMVAFGFNPIPVGSENAGLRLSKAGSHPARKLWGIAE